ncbi:amidohydrolase family protein [Tundrisphaera lichenicola]|uniref:amidohydrolase family protein n=1 Tax=Tundrisphaera lichenicola TaxID=2029860 RepID=UPI003EBA6A2F
MTRSLPIAAVTAACVLAVAGADRAAGGGVFAGLKEINPPAEAEAGQVVAIVGARLIDGRGTPTVPDSAILLRGSRIIEAGPRASTTIPAGARVFDASGFSILPGLVDTHYHNDGDGIATELPALVLSRGTTTLRDPSLPIADYDPVRRADRPMPRCFLTGRHFDQEPHAYPHDAVTVRSPEEARATVASHLAKGASAIKVYFRLPLEEIRVTCEAAHQGGVPVTAHLELVDADDAIRAGLDGIEHVTSFGTALASPAAAEAFREAVRRDNEARRDGRYRLWADIDLDDPARVKPLVDLMLERRVVLSATLAVFERRAGDRNTEDFHVRGFRQMLRFVGLCHRAGVPIVVGSHSGVPHAGHGWAYQRELELLVEAGLTPAEAIEAATLQGARFLGCAERLGSIEPGKVADLILVAGDPLADIGVMRSARHVLLEGRWVGEPPRSAKAPEVRP